jgi:hypothetical protein
MTGLLFSSTLSVNEYNVGIIFVLQTLYMMILFKYYKPKTRELFEILNPCAWAGLDCWVPAMKGSEMGYSNSYAAYLELGRARWRLNNWQQIEKKK